MPIIRIEMFEGRTVDLSSNEPALISDYSVFYINQVQRGFPSQELLDYFEDRQPLRRYLVAIIP